jgi:DNA-directed RNA polymerase specialized sigma24 family protein
MTTATVIPTGRATALAAFYTRHRADLEQGVAARARNVPEATIEDACAFAWLALVRREDVTLDTRGVGWLATVATHEAWRLAATDREIPAGAFLSDPDEPGELREPAGPTEDPLEHTLARDQHRERVAAFATLRPRERRDLLLHAAGYAYHEIATLTGSTFTAVNRRLREGRATLRRVA